MLAQASGQSKQWIKERTAPGRRHELYPAVESAIDIIMHEIQTEELHLKPIRYRAKVDSCSGKVRLIAIEDVKQQMMDAIADSALQPMMKRVGEYQVACIKGRGGSFGARAVKRWMKSKDIRFAVQADIQQCYPSVDRKKLFEFLRKHIKNKKLLWLLHALTSTHRQGLDIGCILSKDLVNIYLSELYHKIMERMHWVRNRRGVVTSERLCAHCLFQMDDILCLCKSRKLARELIQKIITEAHEMGFQIKNGWKIIKLAPVGEKSNIFVDILGIRFYRESRAIRRGTFLKIRRAFLMAKERIRRHKSLHVWLARRIVSYWGILMQTSSDKIIKAWKAYKSFTIAKGVVSNAKSCI